MKSKLIVFDGHLKKTVHHDVENPVFKDFKSILTLTLLDIQRQTCSIVILSSICIKHAEVIDGWCSVRVPELNFILVKWGSLSSFKNLEC